METVEKLVIQLEELLDFIAYSNNFKTHKFNTFLITTNIRNQVVLILLLEKASCHGTLA